MNIDRLHSVTTDLLMLAQENEAAPAAGQDPMSQLLPLLPMLVIGGLMFFFMIVKPQQREQQERQKKLDALKKNDKVLTIGGIIGTIVDLSQDGKRVTLRVDDGTRIKFLRTSIQGPYSESESEGTDAAKP